MINGMFGHMVEAPLRGSNNLLCAAMEMCERCLCSKRRCSDCDFKTLAK